MYDLIIYIFLNTFYTIFIFDNFQLLINKL